MGTGWVALSTVLSFKRMQEIIARSSRSATISEFAIVNALRAAYPSSDENANIEISSDGNDIRRKQPLREPGKTDQMDRSVYVKGFPEEEQKSDSGDRREGRGQYVSSQLQKDLEKWFESLSIGKVNAVRMRRDDQKKFKQSVFVEYATLESAKALVEMDPKPTYKGEKEPVEVMFKKAYIDMKAKEKGIAPQYATGRQNNAQSSTNKRPFNAFKDYAQSGQPKAPTKVTVYVEGKEMEVDSETGKLKTPEDLTYTSGKILKFEITEGSDEFNPYHLKQALQTVHAAAFVDHEKGSSTGIVFFKEPVSEEALQKIRDTELKIGGDESKVACTWTPYRG
jgi:lupus La protein